MTLVDIFLWPGTKICERMGIEPKSDAGLVRSMFNMLVYLVVLLALVWFIKA